MQKIGSYYNWSKKYSFYIPPKKALFYLTLSILNGLLFERIIFGWDVSPFLTVILKFVFAISCFFISAFAIDDIIIPNKRVVYFIALLISLISWYTLWALAITRFDESSFFSSLFHPFKVLIFFAKVQEYQASPLFPDTMAFFVSIMIIYDDPDFFIRNKTWKINKDYAVPQEDPNHMINIVEEHQENTDENTINFNDIHNK